METRLWRLRMAALMGAGTFAVHQLRFLLAFGDGAANRLALEGHAYLVAVGPLVVWLLLAAFAHFLLRASRGVPGRERRGRRLWAGTSAALLCAYCAQELIEGFVASGHPAGLVGIVGDGGWLAVPLAAIVGLAIALVMRGADAAPALLAARRPWTTPPPSAPLRLAAPPLPDRPRPLSLAIPLPARGPPAASV